MRNIFGLIIVLFGLGFLLQELHIPGADRVMELWLPLVIIVVGIIAWSSNRRTWFGPMIVVLIGVILLVNDLGTFQRSAWDIFWPVVIILIGGRIFFGRSWEGHMKNDTGPADANVLFSGVDRKVTGPITTSSISAWFGGVKLDLREAQFADQATLKVSAGFGGIELLVPKNIKVITHMTPMFGGADDKTTPDSTAIKTLTITGSALFGGVKIGN